MEALMRGMDEEQMVAIREVRQAQKIGPWMRHGALNAHTLAYTPANCAARNVACGQIISKVAAFAATFSTRLHWTVSALIISHQPITMRSKVGRVQACA